MSALLLNERFVAVFPSLVRALGGLTEAAVLQEIHYQLQTGSREQNGQRWVPATYRDLAEAIGLSPDQITRATRKLRDAGVLVTANPEAFQRRTWWRIDYDRLDHLAESQNGSRESARSHSAKSRNPNRESAGSTSLVEKRETSKNLEPPPSGAAVVKAFVDRFEQLHKRPPDRQLIGRIGRDAKRMLGEGTDLCELVDGAKACAEGGHGNLPAAVTRLIASRAGRQPKGFSGIRDYLEDLA